ncbi:hypothetical protein AbraCBS73388_007104 [Aspergillus brasiliensis]|uniref:amidase n=1 Tax=Aspergillus brasiliensis TaxID=319629 RepID=A0A9W5YPM7_9EURO|nr:hypothetical protein AbraCBS73388_007104 [Aspergillus brasiliensis]
MSLSWELQAQKARDNLQGSIPKQWLLPAHKLPSADLKNVEDFPRKSGLLSARELSITDMSAATLVQNMGTGKFTAEEVVVAFLKRSVLGHQLLNFATEFLTDRAIARAKELDEYYRRTGKLVGPLHGVPISVKEHVEVKGLTCNAGYVACNNLTGTTLNPYNRTLSAGGSSGGEGASTGFKCAPLGIGTDIGGSIRAPAAFCGSYGFRPTALRNPMTGAKAPEPGHESIRGVIGPLASQSVEDMDLFQQAIIDQEPWDIETSLAPIPWKRAKPTKDMTVAIMWDDGVVRPHPPITRALKHAKAKLQAAGIKVVDWEPYKHKHGWDIISAMYFPDGALSQRKLIAQTGEPILPLTAWAFNYSSPTPLTVGESWELNVQRDVYRDEYHALMKSRGVDFILCPVYAGVASVLGESHYWNYTAVWNILDQPAVVFPSGLSVDPQLDQLTSEDKTYRPRGEIDQREWSKYTGPERYEGAPIALQLVGKHFKDEETLAAGALVDGILKGAEQITTKAML